MSYWLHFYSLPPAAQAHLPRQPEQVTAFLNSKARKVGEIPFSAGEASLLLNLVGDLIDVPLIALKKGELGGIVFAADSPSFGGLPRELGEEAVVELRKLQRGEEPYDQENLGAIAVRYTIPPEEFARKLELLASLIEQSLANGGELATFYE